MSHSSLAAYRKLSIDYSKRHCRILQLLPGTHEEIHCTLQLVNLDESTPPYECVSYVWGDLAISKPIWVEGQELQVTTNLLEFLQHIRHPHDAITLWIDAVCMNQDDLVEKSHQVWMMGDIYSRCSVVHVWLGAPQKPITTDPFSLIRHFANGNHIHALPGFSKDQKGEWTFETNEIFMSIWESFLNISNSLWWTRAWTVQEIILPERSLVWYGPWKTTYETISLARENRNDHLRTCCARSLELIPNTLRRQLDFFLGDVERIDYIHYPRHWKSDPALASRVMSRLPTEPRKLAEIILSFASRTCKDPRDKVYPLLGLAERSVFENYRPNYDHKVATCYTEVFRRLLQENGNDYRILIGNAFGITYLHLPSWVRDFSQVYSRHLVGIELRRLHVYDLYNSSGGSFGEVEIKNEKELRVTGLKVDTVIEVGPAIDYIKAGGAAIQVPLEEWTKMCGRAINSTNGKIIQNALSRVLCGELNHDLMVPGDWRRHKDSDAPSEVAWQKFLSGEISALENAYLGAVELVTAGRSLYRTQNGNVGICNVGAEPGDEVWVLYGMKVPFTLRSYRVLSGHGGLARSTIIHHRLWEHCQHLVRGIIFGQEKRSKAKTRTRGSIEALLLIIEWHPQAIHLPPASNGWDSSTLLTDFYPRDDQFDNQADTADDNEAQWLRDVILPAKTSDRMPWMLLGCVQSLALELGLCDDGERVDVSAKPAGFKAEQTRLRDLLYIFLEQQSSRLGCPSMMPTSVSRFMSESSRRDVQGDSAIIG
ncbi:ARO80-positive transcription regulator of ARO9 and ARO10, partial [Fusarium subglutinans]